MGASALAEGIAEATAPMVRVFSGALSDYRGRRKGVPVTGYGLVAVLTPRPGTIVTTAMNSANPAMPIAASV